MRSVLAWCTCLFFSILLAGCSLIAESDVDDDLQFVEGFSIETEQTVYLIAEDQTLTITYTYINEGKHALYPGSCLGVSSDVLEKYIDGEWALAYDPVCARPLGPPLKVEAGEQYVATIELTPSTWDPVRPDGSWSGGDIEGSYRVRELVYSTWDEEKFDKSALYSEIVVSNAFELRRKP